MHEDYKRLISEKVSKETQEEIKNLQLFIIDIPIITYISIQERECDKELYFLVVQASACSRYRYSQTSRSLALTSG